MKTFHEPAREIPIAAEADVVVAGGGPGGMIAAMAAARGGAKTLPIEKFGYLGGVATAGPMTSFNGFRNEHPPNHVQTVRGIAQEMVDRLVDAGGATGSTAPPRTGSGAVQLNAMACLPNAICLETGPIRPGSQLKLVDGCALLPSGPGFAWE